MGPPPEAPTFGGRGRRELRASLCFELGILLDLESAIVSVALGPFWNY